jgi:hypothetical protein
MEILLPKTGAKDIQDIQETFENDLHAFYNLLLKEVLNVIESDTKEDISGILEKVDSLFA